MDYITETFFVWLVSVLFFSFFAFFRKEARHDCIKAAAGGTTILLAVVLNVIVENLLKILF